LLVEELLQIFLQSRQRGARRLQDLHRHGIGGQRVENVLQRHKLVPSSPRLIERRLNGRFQLFGDGHSSSSAGSSVQSSGNSAFSASSTTWATLVSAISYVYTPAIPIPCW